MWAQDLKAADFKHKSCNRSMIRCQRNASFTAVAASFFYKLVLFNVAAVTYQQACSALEGDLFFLTRQAFPRIGALGKHASSIINLQTLTLNFMPLQASHRHETDTSRLQKKQSCCSLTPCTSLTHKMASVSAFFGRK